MKKTWTLEIRRDGELIYFWNGLDLDEVYDFMDEYLSRDYVAVVF